MGYCDICDNEMDTDCNGNPRCEMCDGPCPCCDDGGGPTLDLEYEDDELDHVEAE